ncbi:chromate resistance protein ChrB domain-containing protein [Aquabacterium sp.]|uniref:chromate resistance protein ChrB domain-containing protein n=1 Tax=Aquabacterium sp. TaxID=1872578 RepID=UPI00403812B3
MKHWLILTATLPTSPSGLRVKVWRALKATGAGTLREGVYVLPAHAASAHALADLERTINDAGAEAHLLTVQARDEAQEHTFRSLFDRAALYADFLQSAKALRHEMKSSSEVELRKSLRRLDAQLHDIQAHDFFPGTDSQKASEALAALRREIELHFSPDEPSAASALIERRATSEFQGCTWATRQRPWVDRLASAWLVQRFVDPEAKFIWLADVSDCPKGAVGYDYNGAAFTHVGDRVTFEVVAETFGLTAGNPAMQRLAVLVHCLDVGGHLVDEAAGLEMLIRGLHIRHPDDDDLLAAALPLFDACFAALKAPNDH